MVICHAIVSTPRDVDVRSAFVALFRVMHKQQMRVRPMHSINNIFSFPSCDVAATFLDLSYRFFKFNIEFRYALSHRNCVSVFLTYLGYILYYVRFCFTLILIDYIYIS